VDNFPDQGPCFDFIHDLTLLVWQQEGNRPLDTYSTYPQRLSSLGCPGPTKSERRKDRSNCGKEGLLNKNCATVSMLFYWTAVLESRQSALQLNCRCPPSLGGSTSV